MEEMEENFPIILQDIEGRKINFIFLEEILVEIVLVFSQKIRSQKWD